MKDIIQLHPFADGNKRMGLAVAYYYMFKNECLLLTPLSAVRFSVLIAKQEKNFQEIKEWVQLHTAHNYEEYHRKSYELVTRPMAKWLLSYSQATRENDQIAIQNANDIMDNWLARDIYPEYQKMTTMEIVEFINELVKNVPESPRFYKRKQ